MHFLGQRKIDFAWQRSTQFDVYENYKSLTVVLGERDTTLDLKEHEGQCPAVMAH
jgi:hypothetical protein